MAYTLKTNLANRKNYGGARSTSSIKWLVVHYTANDGDTDESNAIFFKNNIPKASAHYFIDDDSVTQSVPDNYAAYAVGGTRFADYAKTGGASLYKKITNSNSISVEMCDTQKNGKHDVSEKTLANTIAFCKVLMKKYNIDINHVVRHFDVTGKRCPAYYINSSMWANFKIRLQQTVSDSNIKNITTSSTSGAYSQAKFIKEVCELLNVKTAREALPLTVTISANTNKNHALVTPLERYMKLLGYYTGAIEADSGKHPSFGPNMTNAIKKYQTYVVKFSNTKNIDGIITAKNTTWKKLLGL